MHTAGLTVALLVAACGNSPSMETGDAAIVSEDAATELDAPSTPDSEPWTVPVATLARTAVTFDGVADTYSFGKSPRLQFDDGDTITIAAWVNPSSIDGFDPILGRPAPCATSGNYFLDFGSGLRFCYDGATEAHCARLVDTVPTNTWTHVAVTYRFGDASSFRGYVNGELMNNGSWYYGTGAEAPRTSWDHEVHAGSFAGCQSGSNYFFQGQMARLVLYDRMLSEDEIHAHARAQQLLPCTDIAHELRPMTQTLLDDNATGYATFQSYNQKVVANEDGIFTSHIRTRNAEFTAQTWRLSRSQDDGATFSTVFEETVGTNPPAIELDLLGNLYAMRQDYRVTQVSDSLLYLFLKATNYTSHATFTIPDGNSGKFAMLYDPIRRRLYYFSHGGKFYVVDPSGAVISSTQLIVSGTSADPQYPLLTMDERGTIVAAWTNVQKGLYMYWSIHAIRSVNGGASWQKLDGTPLATPMACDETGPADRITLNDEYDSHTWLWNLLAKNGKIHFAYLAQTATHRQHYVRYDATTGAEDLRIQPTWRADQITFSGLDGFVVTDPWSPRRLFWVSVAVGSQALGVMQSIDDGATWHDFARTTTPVGAPYGVGGFREVTSRGHLIGTYTDVANANQPQVQFFKVPVRAPSDPLICL